MLPLGLSSLELRNIIECAFLPLHCTCSCVDGLSYVVQISDPSTGKVSLLERDVAPERLASSRAIAQLIAELRSRLQQPAYGFETARRVHAG